MQWKKLNDYAISCGKYVICRAVVGGKDRFHLSRGVEDIGYFDAAADARAAAERHDRNEIAGAM